MTCKDCTKSQTNVDWPIYQAQCKGCAVRSIAQSLHFHRASVEGSLSAEYRKALAGVFGDDWRKGHEQVKSERKRIAEGRVIL